MKRLTLILPLLLLLGGCKWIKETTVETCNALETVQSGISDVGEFLGSPGTLVAGGLNMLLEFTCRVIASTGGIPQNITDLITGEEAEPDAEVADVDTDPDPVDG